MHSQGHSSQYLGMDPRNGANYPKAGWMILLRLPTEALVTISIWPSALRRQTGAWLLTLLCLCDPGQAWPLSRPDCLYFSRSDYSLSYTWPGALSPFPLWVLFHADHRVMHIGIQAAQSLGQGWGTLSQRATKSSGMAKARLLGQGGAGHKRIVSQGHFAGSCWFGKPFSFGRPCQNLQGSEDTAKDKDQLLHSGSSPGASSLRMQGPFIICSGPACPISHPSWAWSCRLVCMPACRNLRPVFPFPGRTWLGLSCG